MRRVLIAIGLLLPSGGVVVAHPGGLDANGGHLNHKTGEYHFHRQVPAAPAPALVTPRLAVPSPRMTARTAPPPEAAWSENGASKKFRTTLAAQKLKDAEADPKHSRMLLLEIVAEFSDTPSAPVARRILEEQFEQDRPQNQSIAAERSEKHAASKLYFARQLMEQGKPDAAKRTLTDLVREYPDSTSASEARKLLKVIP